MRLLHSADCTSAQRAEIRELCDQAFEGNFSDTDFDHALGGMHVLIRSDDRRDELAGHAAVVQRSLLVGRTPCRAGYVEAVAVNTAHRRQGIGARLMAEIERIVGAAYDLGALGASQAGRTMYLSRGWTPWTGPLGASGPDGYVPTPDDQGSVLVWSPDGTDTGQPLTCDWRSGALW